MKQRSCGYTCGAMRNTVASRITHADSETRTGTGAKSSSSSWRAYIGALGPGLVTGASDDDPSGIATYAQAGARFKYGLAWTALATLPLMSAVQEICDRSALATGRTLGELASVRFDQRRRLLGALIVAMIGANVLNIAADLVAIGNGMHLLHAGPSLLWAILAGFGLGLLVVSGSFSLIASVFKTLALVLIAYLVVLVEAHVNWGEVVRHTFVPQFELSRDSVSLLVAVLG